MNEQRDKERREARTTGQSCRLWTLRILVNIFVLGALGGSGYLIYYTTQISSEVRLVNWFFSTHALSVHIERIGFIACVAIY